MPEVEGTQEVEGANNEWQTDFHQENLSAIIAGCRVYNWAANCDAVVKTAIWLESVYSFSWMDDTKCARVKFHPVTCWFISWFLIIFSHISLLRFSHSNHHRLPPLLHISSLRLRHIHYNIVRSCGLNVVFSLHVNPQVCTVCGMPLSGHCSLANLWQYLS